MTLNSDRDYRVHAVNNTLVLHNVVQSDTGNYTCHVTNMAATRAKTVSIVVSGKLLRLPYYTLVEVDLACVTCSMLHSSLQYKLITDVKFMGGRHDT